MSSNMRSFLHKRYRQEIRHLLPKLVKIEGPIHVDHAYKRINKAVKIPIATSSIHNIYLDTVTELASKGKVIRNGPFLWPELGNVTISVRVPNIQHGEDNRSIEYIASEEIQSAMKIILKHSMGLSKESLIQETSEIFKVRQTLKTKRILELAIEDMIRKKSITMNANVLTLTI